MQKIKNYGKKLNEFYNSDIGKLAAWFVRKELIEILEQDKSEKEKTACYGFTSPYIDLIENSTINLTPFKTSFSGEVVSEHDKLPIRDAQLDKIIAIHAVDHYEFPEQVIAEFWRILEPEGKLVLVVVNQDGFWKKAFCNETVGLTKTYVKEALSFNKFFTNSFKTCLHFPPTKWLSATKTFDKLGKQIFRRKAGVIIFEVEKKLFAPRGRTIKVTPSLRDLLLGPKKVANTKDIA